MCRLDRFARSRKPTRPQAAQWLHRRHSLTAAPPCCANKTATDRSEPAAVKDPLVWACSGPGPALPRGWLGHRLTCDYPTRRVLLPLPSRARDRRRAGVRHASPSFWAPACASVRGVRGVRGVHARGWQTASRRHKRQTAGEHHESNRSREGSVGPTGPTRSRAVPSLGMRRCANCSCRSGSRSSSGSEFRSSSGAKAPRGAALPLCYLLLAPIRTERGTCRSACV